MLSHIISNWFLEHESEFTVLKCPPQSPHLNPAAHLWDVVKRASWMLSRHVQMYKNTLIHMIRQRTFIRLLFNLNTTIAEETAVMNNSHKLNQLHL